MSRRWRGEAGASRVAWGGAGTDGDCGGIGYAAGVRESEIFLREESGPRRGRVHALRPGRLVIGRDPAAAVVLASGDVSRFHASLEVTPEAIVVADLGSKNGISLKVKDGEEPLVRPTALRHGDVLVVGGISLAVHHPGAQVDAALRRVGEATVTRATPPGPRTGEPIVWPVTAVVMFAALVVGLLVWQ